MDILTNVTKHIAQMDPQLYGQLLYSRVAKVIQWEYLEFSPNGGRTTGYGYGKNKKNFDFYLIDTWIKSEWITDMNIRAKYITVIEETQNKSLWLELNILFKHNTKGKLEKKNCIKWTKMINFSFSKDIG